MAPATPVSKTGRTPIFTPNRVVTRSATSTPNSSLSSKSTASSLLSSNRKYKAPLSTESRARTTPKPRLAPVPASPTRPRTPATPRGESPFSSPALGPALSEMDVSNVDPETVLVDWKNVEPSDPDASGEIDPNILRDFGKEDKVMVSIRVRPTGATSAWNTTPLTNLIQLNPLHSKHPASSNPLSSNSAISSDSNTFTFDSILLGSPNKPIYTTVARSHVLAAMEGFNSLIFAYGQTASGKTYTLSGDESIGEPGIIPRAMRDVFGYIRGTTDREYLLRCSYLEIYNETIFDLLAPPSSANQVQIQGAGNDVILTPLREEVVTSLKGVKDVLKRGEKNRRTACTDWNERSSRSHSVFRLVIESRERGNGDGDAPARSETPVPPNGRHTPGLSGRNTPGFSGRQTPAPGAGPRLQARGGRSIQVSVLSLIDLAGSEKATSDKERTREGRYINTSLLTLGTVIGTLSENAAKNKNDHIPYRNSKLTRLLQPSLSGNARISVICTINPEPSAVSESLSTLGFARRIRGVKLNATKKEIVDTDALIERYRKEIEELKCRLAEKESQAQAPEVVHKRRLSAREKQDESHAMKDLNNRIQQLTKLILTSQTVEELSTSDSRPSSPVKVDFDMGVVQLQQELLTARHQLETQARQILSLEAALDARPLLNSENTSDGTDETQEKDKTIAQQADRLRELEDTLARSIAGSGNEDVQSSLREEMEKVIREELEREWQAKLTEEIKKYEEEARKREEVTRWADELVKQVEKERKNRMKLEGERRALAAFVSKFDSLALGGIASTGSTPRPSLSRLPRPSLDSIRERRESSMSFTLDHIAEDGSESPFRIGDKLIDVQPSLLEEKWNHDDDMTSVGDVSFEMLEGNGAPNAGTGHELEKEAGPTKDFKGHGSMKALGRKVFGAFKDKENQPVRV